ncbi:hypothetical protein [Aquimarina sp. 2201CG5-10]|uniref:hypothetical protein n=1 Tax=Aquimarina callyspongiae TaxID=3098150 RepID=UPI002AB41D30|nr:hypothetical protein [Aquimarina sp. 2201CG5-10]MDY8136276.1 hypothetical protein [Aquimarina sp. 2201CG5-10]
MKKLIGKSILYSTLILLSLEGLVRVFHLGKDTPNRYLDEYNVEKWKPNQNGVSVTGNRKQNFAEYRINESGYNSYREFTPTKDKIEIALVGDSFIEGFHQNYYNSIGKKIESILSEVDIFEYGYAGYDMADQLHLINAYKDQFELIDHVILGFKFSNDLTRNKYEVIHERLALESPLNKLLKKSKLLVYCKSIGILDPPKRLISKVINTVNNKKKKTKTDSEKTARIKAEKEKKYIKNFKSLVATYGFDKEKFTLLLDSKVTSQTFLSYLDKNDFNYIDFSQAMEASKKPTTLIYDRHWNNHGRDIIANLISEYLSKNSITNK